MTTVDDSPTRRAVPAVIVHQRITSEPPCHCRSRTGFPPYWPSCGPASTASRPTNIGFPSTLDLDITPLMPFFNYVLNNVGDPDQARRVPGPHQGPGTRGRRHHRRAFSAPRPTTGGATSPPAAARVSSTGCCSPAPCYPDAVVYSQQQSHYSIAKIAGEAADPGRARPRHRRRADGPARPAGRAAPAPPPAGRRRGQHRHHHDRGRRRRRRHPADPRRHPDHPRLHPRRRRPVRPAARSAPATPAARVRPRPTAPTPSPSAATSSSAARCRAASW